MRIVRDRADARWLPSRFNFALFRLYAFLRLRSAAPEPQPGLILSIDRHQNAFENHATAVVVVIVVASFFSSPLAGLLVAVLSVQPAIVIAGLICRAFRSANDDVTHISGTMIMAVVIACAAWSARTNVVAAAFLGLLLLNAIAAAVLFVIRAQVAAIEARFE